MRNWSLAFVCSIWIGAGLVSGCTRRESDISRVTPFEVGRSVAISTTWLVEPTASNDPTSSLVQEAAGTPNSTTTSTKTITSRPSQTPSLQLSPTSKSPTISPTPLKFAVVDGIKGRWQTYSLSCEARSAVDWAAFFGTQIDESEFQNRLPVSDDPDVGFVGDVREPWGQTPPNSYGIHAKPVAALLRDYGLEAEAVDGITWEKLQAEISQDRPVIVWVVGRVGRGTPISYTTSSGNETTVTRFEHTVILTGYTQTDVEVLDGYWFYTRSIQDFLASWGVLGNMAVIWSDSYGENEG